MAEISPIVPAKDPDVVWLKAIKIKHCKRDLTGVFEVEKINPPPKSLGIHHLPVDTHNGDQITVEDEVNSDVIVLDSLA